MMNATTIAAADSNTLPLQFVQCSPQPGERKSKKLDPASALAKALTAARAFIDGLADGSVPLPKTLSAAFATTASATDEVAASAAALTLPRPLERRDLHIEILNRDEGADTFAQRCTALSGVPMPVCAVQWWRGALVVAVPNEALPADSPARAYRGMLHITIDYFGEARGSAHGTKGLPKTTGEALAAAVASFLSSFVAQPAPLPTAATPTTTA